MIGIGIVILNAFTSNIGCPTGTLFNSNGANLTVTTNLCCLTTASNCTSGQGGSAVNTPGTSVYTLSGYLGTGSGGLATWVPIIIVLTIGMVFLSVFLGNQKKKA